MPALLLDLSTEKINSYSMETASIKSTLWAPALAMFAALLAVFTLFALARLVIHQRERAEERRRDAASVRMSIEAIRARQRPSRPAAHTPRNQPGDRRLPPASPRPPGIPPADSTSIPEPRRHDTAANIPAPGRAIDQQKRHPRGNEFTSGRHAR